MKYRKKPVVIDAWPARKLINDAKGNFDALPRQVREAYDMGNLTFKDAEILIKTSEGAMLAYPEDWVICGVVGELYPCKPDVFEKTYDAADDPDSRFGREPEIQSGALK